MDAVSGWLRGLSPMPMPTQDAVRALA